MTRIFPSICQSNLLLIAAICVPLLLSAQKEQYKVGCIGFYNVENLFDTEDDPTIRDEDFTPEGALNYTEKIYTEKMGRIADVIEQVGTELSPDGLSILGLAEIENRKVLEDLVQHPTLAPRRYQIIHYNSPDRRGIDVALLYQPKYFTPTATRAVSMLVPTDEGDTLYTRDILLVSGTFDHDPIHILVNHWPSRRGGEKRSQPLRNMAAYRNKQIVDSLQKANPQAKVVIMGDLNDDPVSPSVKEVLNAKGQKKKVAPQGLYNPMFQFYKKGIGTTAYRDAWSLFDQLIVSEGLLSEEQKGYYFHKAKVFNKKFLTQSSGQFKGYPKRTFAGGQYLGGFSDHFPVYLYLLKKV